jgi:hypothetical protein
MTKEVVPLTLAAKRTALGEPAIRRGIRLGTIDACKMGRDWYLPISEVERLAREYPLEG